MVLEAVVAVYADWSIGLNGTQPVVLQADRAHFRRLTRGAAVIVGRRTLADFPGGRPLKGRDNIVLTRQDLEIPGAKVVHSPEEALAAARGAARCLVIGGESVYRAMLPWVRLIHVTQIELLPETDRFFPDLDASPAWRQAECGPWQEEAGARFRFTVYRRTGG